MANDVKIVTLAPPAVADTPPDALEQAVRQVSEIWRGQLGLVLPDRPDRRMQHQVLPPSEALRSELEK